MTTRIPPPAMAARPTARLHIFLGIALNYCWHLLPFLSCRAESLLHHVGKAFNWHLKVTNLNVDITRYGSLHIYKSFFLTCRQTLVLIKVHPYFLGLHLRLGYGLWCHKWANLVLVRTLVSMAHASLPQPALSSQNKLPARRYSILYSWAQAMSCCKTANTKHIS